MHSITLTLNILAILCLLFAWLLLWRTLHRQQAARWSAAVVGALTFVLVARVIEPLALHALGLTSWLGSARGMPLWVILAFASLAALFEEAGRGIALVSGLRRAANPTAWTWSFAAGYAGAELVLIGVVSHGQLLALAHSPDGGAALLQTLPPELRTSLQRGLSELGPMSALWLLIERLAALVFQMSLTLLVSSAIAKRSPASFIAAVGMHTVIDLPAAAYQGGHVSLSIVEVIYLFLGLAATWRLCRLWGRVSKNTR